MRYFNNLFRAFVRGQETVVTRQERSEGQMTKGIYKRQIYFFRFSVLTRRLDQSRAIQFEVQRKTKRMTKISVRLNSIETIYRLTIS
jgi:hypothetical protein